MAAFQSNVRKRRIHSKMNVRLPKTVKELYTLVDNYAQMEEGRKLPREEVASMLIRRMRMNQPVGERLRSAIRSQVIRQ